MAGCSILTNDGSALDCVEIVSSYQRNGRCLATDNPEKDGVDDSQADSTDKLRCLFDQVLSVFLKEIGSRGVIRPVPAMLGDGRSPDLFRLFCVVRERGGFEVVSDKRSWASVVAELGLDLRVTPSVKLMYYKYLIELEKWFKLRCRDRKLGNGQWGCEGTFGLLSLELETELSGLLTNGPGKMKKKHVGIVSLESCKSETYIDMDIGKIGFDSSDSNMACRIRDIGNGHVDADKTIYDDDKDVLNDDGTDHVILDSSIAEKVFNCHKRKRESLAGMLKWVNQIAKHPGDPSIGVEMEPSNWKEYGGKEFWDQAIRAREALLLRRHVNPKTEESLLEKRPKVHPSMYEDSGCPNHHSTERLRCSERVPSLVKCRACSCCNSCSATQSKFSPHKIELDSDPKEQEPVADDISIPNTIVSSAGDNSPQKQVRVDSHLQAKVPEWTGVVSEGDSKWLGTCVWPLEHETQHPPIETDPIGMGRLDSCCCRLPSSVECVRFHIAERRMKLKRELGPVFYHWKFDRMGEEVSLQWTAVEEQRFKDMVRSNLWDKAFKRFPRKRRENLVSYYFNVFLVQRRRYQNHVNPSSIDSDDDESEFGSLSDRFGNEALKVPGLSFLACSENKQCTDFE